MSALMIAAAVVAAAPVDARGPVYDQVAPMDATVQRRLMPQVEALLVRLLREKRSMTLGGVKVFESGDKFLPGKIAAAMAYRVLELPPGDPRLAQRLRDFADVADLTIDDANDSWGIYYYASALNSLRKAGLLDRAVRPATLATLRQRLDWRRFVRADLTLIDLPNNYYGVAFAVAGLRHLLGWEDETASRALLARTLDHYRRYSGDYGFADETEGEGRYDRYSVLLIGEIAQRMEETGIEPGPEVKRWLRRSVDLMLPRFNLRGEGWEYGRSIGAYGETAFLEVLTAAAKLKVLTPQEERMAYAFSSRIAARYMDFWVDPATGSVDLWGKGRRTDAYRGKHRIFGENLSLARQYVYTNAIWGDLGYRGRATDAGYRGWLAALPARRFDWFAKGTYDRGLLTLRDRGRVVSLPLINGAEGQHMHNPYFPVPFSPGMLQGSADADYPNLVPRITMADGSAAMPLAYFAGVRVDDGRETTTVSWRQPQWDRMGGKDAVADSRLSGTTRYRFAPGMIEREDRVVARGGAPARVEIQFASFSSGGSATGGDIAWRQGDVTRFETSGYGACTVRPVADDVHAATTAPMRSLVTCTRQLAPGEALTLRWKLYYNPWPWLLTPVSMPYALSGRGGDMRGLPVMSKRRTRTVLLIGASLLAATAAAAQEAQRPTGAAQAGSVASPSVQPNPVQPEGAPTDPTQTGTADTAAPGGDPIAQAAAEADAQSQGDIVVTGARATQRTSIELKRNSSVTVDGLVSDEIGATPDNSVGDTLERITGVTADRFKGNANELSVRGLGPTLSFSTFNGREVSTAGPDSSVAFQQFPSELVNGVLVYKSQQADFIEGGVGGVIELRSIKPLDYGKRRIQAEIRGDFQPKADDVYQSGGLGYRANISYTDSFKTGIGDIGISIGYQRQDTTAPEDYYNANATFQVCNTVANNPFLTTGTAAQQVAAGAGANCTLATGPRSVAPATGQAPVAVGETRGDYYFANSSRSFRAQQTAEVRDAVIGALQWRPTPEFEIAVDGQYSNRDSLEKRNVLAIAEGLRGIQPLVIGTGDNGYSKGALISYRGNSNIEDQLERRSRVEEYLGGGLSLSWRPDDWIFTADGSYSNSHRTETQKQTRMRSTTRVPYELSYIGDSVVPSVTFGNGFDVTNPANFLATAANAVYARNRFVTDRKDTIWAGRFDVERRFETSFLTSFKFGARYSDHHRTNDNARNNDLNTLVNVNGLTPAQLITQANQNCRAPFTTRSYMAGQGTNLTQWATFDNDCLFRTFTGSDDALPYPADGRDPSDIDVSERIYAAYAMASFRSELSSLPFSGNVGVRWIDTKIRSTGFRQAYLITIDPGSDSYTVAVDPSGQLSTNRASGGYRYLLPSANIAFDISDQLKLRLAGYRAIARSGIESFGAGINLNPSTGTGGLNNIIFNATTGNPNLKPLRAWNADASLELYASKDTLLALAGYYKWVVGTVIGASTTVPVPITVTTVTTTPTGTGPRQTVDLIINPVRPANDSETRNLYGLEFTGSHAFTWLPSPLDGFGVQASVNRAFANFEYPDTSGNAISQYLEPNNLIGLSKWTASGSVYFEKWGLSLRANYRYRSSYYKPNGGTNRSVRGADYLNLSLQYNLTPRVQFKAQALNITGTKDVFYKAGYDSIAEVSNSGPQYFAGFRIRL